MSSLTRRSSGMSRFGEDPPPPEPLFDHMARLTRPDLKFTPPETETQVERYLSKLLERTAETAFDPHPGVNALVFGEWGHGKSQVLYRTAHALVGRPHAVALRIVPERLSAEGLL